MVLRRAGRLAVSKLKLLSLLLVIAGCTTNYDIPIEPTPAKLPINMTKVDVSIGVFYDGNFTSYVHTDLVSSSIRDIYVVGIASKDYFDTVFDAQFARTTIVHHRPPLPTGVSPLEAVIEVRMEDFHTEVRMFQPTVVVTVSYRFILYSPRGETIASWTVTGGADPYRPEGWGLRWDVMGEATEYAIEEAGMKFMTGFREVPAIEQWLASGNG